MKARRTQCHSIKEKTEIKHTKHTKYVIFNHQSINLFVMKHSTHDIAVTALTGTTRLKSAYGSPK